MREVRVALIGSGNIAVTLHLPILKMVGGVRVVALCDFIESRVEEVARRFEVKRTYNDVDLMLDSEELDAVFVTVSASAISKVAAICLRRGVNTFLEKPPGFTAAETRELAGLAAEQNAITMVGLNRRFRPLIRQARDVVEQEGPICTVITEFHSRDMQSWQATGRFSDRDLRNFLVFNSIHAIDLLRYLGGDVEVVSASASAVAPPGFLDSANAMIRFKSGAVGYVSSHHLVPAGGHLAPAGERVEIWGHRICAWLENGHRLLTIWRAGRPPEQLRASGELMEWDGTKAQNEFFIQCVQEGRQVRFPGADLTDAVNTMELVEVIGQSLGKPGLTVAHL